MSNSITKKSLIKNSKLKENSRKLRKQGILSEVIFWNEIKERKFMNLDFDRQRIIGNYIVDFYCQSKQLVVEIDGSSHNSKEVYDKSRETYLESLSLNIIKFADIDVKQNLNGVMSELARRIGMLK